MEKSEELKHRKDPLYMAGIGILLCVVANVALAVVRVEAPCMTKTGEVAAAIIFAILFSLCGMTVGMYLTEYDRRSSSSKE